MAIPLLVPLVAVPAGLAIASNASGETPAAAPTGLSAAGGIRINTPTHGMTVADALTRGAQGGVAVGKAAPIPAGKLARLTGVIAAGQLSANYSSPIDQAVQEKLDIVESYGKAAYNNLSDSAKKAGAKALSDELHLDPPLKGDEDWETIAKIAGGAAGVAAFGWLPGGAVWGPIVGSYLGIKIEELMSKDADKIKDWFKSKWSDIEGWVTGEVHEGVAAVEHFFTSIF